MPKQTKKSVAATPLDTVSTPVSSPAVSTQIAAAPAPVSNVTAAPVAAAPSAEPKKRGRKAKPKASDAAAVTIMLHARRPATDYLFFCEEIRPQIIAENPTMSFTEIGREQGRRWKALPQEVKNMYKARWEEDKKRYEADKAVVDQNRQTNPELFVVKNRKAKKAKKMGAKRARTAFIIFCQEQRPVLRSSKPDLPFTETGRILGQMWKDLAEEKKAVYQAEANKDQERYKQEREALKESQASAPVVVEPKKRGRKPKSAAVAVETEAAVSVPVVAASNVVTAAPASSSSVAAPVAEAAPKKKGRKPKVQNE